MRLNTNPALPGESIDLLRQLRDIAKQVNGISEGQAYAHHGALAAAPTTGSWSISDVVKNSAPVVAGAGGSQYVVTGWICTVSGTPGTWVEMRCLTGS